MTAGVTAAGGPLGAVSITTPPTWPSDRVTVKWSPFSSCWMSLVWASLPSCRAAERFMFMRAAAERDPVLGDLGGVVVAAVVEPGLAVHLELHRAAHHLHHADQAVGVGRLGAGDRHEVEHLTDTVGAEEPGDQDAGARQVQLRADMVGAHRRDPEVSALVLVQQRREDARRVETRRAEPVDRTVVSHQRGSLQIADQAMCLNRRVTTHKRLPMCHDPISQADFAATTSPKSTVDARRRTVRGSVAAPVTREIIGNVRRARRPSPHGVAEHESAPAPHSCLPYSSAGPMGAVESARSSTRSRRTEWLTCGGIPTGWGY